MNKRATVAGAGSLNCIIQYIEEIQYHFSINIEAQKTDSVGLRPYHVECSRSRSISEDKLRRARLVLRWVTAWEHRVLQASFCTCPYRILVKPS